jgi:type VI secretion system protein ImpM
MITKSLPLIYFGKLPSRGDFIRTRSHINETNALDQWVSQALTHSGAILDEATVLNFSHVDTVSGQIITGILIASHDSSHRYYPLIGFSVMHLDKPKSWLNYLPIKSLALWRSIYQALSCAQSKTDNSEIMALLNDWLLTIDQSASTYYYDFISTTTLQDIARSMAIDKSQLIQQIIATGLLFLPTYNKGFSGLNKTLCWTLSTDKDCSIQMATFWHDLIHGFYQPHQLHLNTYLYRSASHYRLLLSFTKPNSDVLSQLSSTKNTYPTDWIIIDDSAWTQSYIDEDIGLTRFNKILLQDDLSLYDTRQLFNKIFLAQ